MFRDPKALPTALGGISLYTGSGSPHHLIPSEVDATKIPLFLRGETLFFVNRISKVPSPFLKKGPSYRFNSRIKS